VGRRASRGFTLVELAVAIGIAVVLGYFLVRTTASILHWSTIQAQRNAEHAAIGELVDRFRAEEDSAWAIFTPDTDVNGASNADGHEVDFFTRDAKYQSYFWAYNYDATRKTLSRYLYSAPGASPTLDQTYAGLSNFYAKTYPLTALQDPTSKVYSPLYNGAALQAGAVRFYGSTYPKIAGGNQITYLRIEGPSLVREMQLATQSAPSGFTVVLNYTPAPTPTVRAALSSWPQYVELPMSGQSLQTSWLPSSHDIAYYLNRLLGGTVAIAALSPCAVNQGRAFTDNTFTAALANSSAPTGSLPSGVNGYTDASGCITLQSSSFTSGMPNVALYEPGYPGAITQVGSSCGAVVQIAASYPASTQGPRSQIVSKGGSSLIQNCTLTWQDQQSAPTQTTTTYEISGCANTSAYSYTLVGIGGTCTSSDPNNYATISTAPDCTPGGSGGIEYSDNGIKSVTGPGTAVDNGDFTVTATRTGTGTIAVSIRVSELMCNGTGTKLVTGSETYYFN